MAKPPTPPTVVNDATESRMIDFAGEPQHFMKRVALGVFAGCLYAFQQTVDARPSSTVRTSSTETSEVMTADEVAAFLGVDRNTVYDYAGRGEIPHQRLGKRILFRRGALMSWLDSCKATSTRKG